MWNSDEVLEAEEEAAAAVEGSERRLGKERRKRKSRKSRRHRRRSGDAEDEEGRASGTFGFNLSSHFKIQTSQITTEKKFANFCCLI